MKCDPKSRECRPRGTWTLIYRQDEKKYKTKKRRVKHEPHRWPSVPRAVTERQETNSFWMIQPLFLLILTLHYIILHYITSAFILFPFIFNFI